MPKCGLCHFGAKRAPTAPLERLGAFGPLRTPKNVGHVCKSAKVIFVTLFSFLQKIKSYKKSLLRFGIRVRRFLVFRGVGIAKLRFERFGALRRSQIAQAALFHTCTTFLGVSPRQESPFRYKAESPFPIKIIKQICLSR